MALIRTQCYFKWILWIFPSPRTHLLQKKKLLNKKPKHQEWSTSWLRSWDKRKLVKHVCVCVCVLKGFLTSIPLLSFFPGIFFATFFNHHHPEKKDFQLLQTFTSITMFLDQLKQYVKKWKRKNYISRLPSTNTVYRRKRVDETKKIKIKNDDSAAIGGKMKFSKKNQFIIYNSPRICNV